MYRRVLGAAVGLSAGLALTVAAGGQGLDQKQRQGQRQWQGQGLDQKQRQRQGLGQGQGQGYEQGRGQGQGHGQGMGQGLGQGLGQAMRQLGGSSVYVTTCAVELPAQGATLALQEGQGAQVQVQGAQGATLATTQIAAAPQMPIFGSSKPTLVPSGILPYKEDRYGGVIVDADATARVCNAHGAEAVSDASGADGRDASGDRPNVPRFAKILADSLSFWRSQERRGVWLRIPLSRSELVPVCVNQGFVFHHAEKDYLMLTHWLSPQGVYVYVYVYILILYILIIILYILILYIHTY
jgi:hypothetical protein